LSLEALTPEILRGGETPARRFDPKSAATVAFKLSVVRSFFE